MLQPVSTVSKRMTANWSVASAFSKLNRVTRSAGYLATPKGMFFILNASESGLLITSFALFVREQFQCRVSGALRRLVFDL